MSSAALKFDIRFSVLDCASCKMMFALPDDVISRYLGNGQRFYCPEGHSNVYRDNREAILEREAAKLRKDLEDEQRRRVFAQENAAAERAAREQTERRLSATKGAKTRIVNRIKNGVCPCCNRTFIDLQRHMKTKHPGFTADSSGTTSGDA